MKHTIAAVILSLATTAPANAAATTTPPTIWQGDIFAASVSTSCSGISVGDYFGQAIYAPGGLPGNSSTDQLAVFGAKAQANQWQPATGSTLSGAKSFNSWNIDNLAEVTSKQNTSGPSFKITPSTISSNTPTVTLTASKNNFNNITGCDVTFKGALGKRPGTLGD